MWTACYASFHVDDMCQEFSQDKESKKQWRHAKARPNNYEKINKLEAGFGNKEVQEIALGSAYIIK